jgi:light-harvesting complex 1 beta chain
MTDIPFTTTQRHAHRGDRIAHALIFIPCFAVLLSVAVLGQMVGLHWKKWLPGAENMNNVYAGVKAAVYTLMSHII